MRRHTGWVFDTLFENLYHCSIIELVGTISRQFTDWNVSFTVTEIARCNTYLICLRISSETTKHTLTRIFGNGLFPFCQPSNKFRDGNFFWFLVVEDLFEEVGSPLVIFLRDRRVETVEQIEFGRDLVTTASFYLLRKLIFAD